MQDPAVSVELNETESDMLEIGNGIAIIMNQGGYGGLPLMHIIMANISSVPMPADYNYCRYMLMTRTSLLVSACQVNWL